LSPEQKFDITISSVKDDPEYKNEKTRFVEGMSYAKALEMPGFAQAIANIEIMIRHIPGA
jgi:hypothetical protein